MISVPVNDTQREFNALCAQRNSTFKRDVNALLLSRGKKLNALAFEEAAEQFAAFPGANPWHICFSIGLGWGHLAHLDLNFTSAVVRLLSSWNIEDLKLAASFHLERGPEPIELSLRGANQLFQKVVLPPELPTTLDQLTAAQNRWLSPILSQNRPAYMGSWNATAMFMVALFAMPDVARQQKTPAPMLPPGGPISTGLNLLSKAKVISRPPDTTVLDEAAFEPGSLYVNNGLLAELCKTVDDACMIDVHSGVYMLGTRYVHSSKWE